MTRFLSLLVLVALCLGCARDTVVPAPIRVGFLLTSLEKERYHKDRAAFAQHARELGAQVTSESARGDSGQQVEQARRLLADGARVLVLHAVDARAAAQVVDLAHRARVPVVAYDRVLPGVPYDWAVVHDSLAVGRAQAEYAVRALGARGGQVAILQGTAGNPVAETITRGNLEVLRKAPGIRVVGIVPHAHWIPDEALASTSRLLRDHPDLAAILANNSTLARGALAALKQAGRSGRVYLAGADADLANCQFVAQGLQGMDVLKEIAPLAHGAAEVAVALAQGRQPEVQVPGHQVVRQGSVPTLILPVRPFDRQNLEQVVVDSGFHPRAALFPPASPAPGGYSED